MLQLMLNLLHFGGQLLHIHFEMLLACHSQPYSPSESNADSCNVVCYNKGFAGTVGIEGYSEGAVVSRKLSIGGSVGCASLAHGSSNALDTDAE